jgi:3-hydroxyisobutyrate dehydrogenase
MHKVGFIGLGNMGKGMAQNLSKNNILVSGFDVDKKVFDYLKDKNINQENNLEKLVKDSEVLITMLPDGPVVKKVWEQIINYSDKDKILIDCSTIDVETSLEVQKLAKVKGIKTLDAPVSGGVMGADSGTLTFMVGGNSDTYSSCKYLFDIMGKNSILCGENGAGQSAKICNNMLLASTMIAVGESFNLAKNLGLNLEKLFEVLSTSSGSCWAINNYCPYKGIGPDSPADKNYNGGFATSLMNKDLSLAIAAAKSSDTKVNYALQSQHSYAKLVADGHGNLDFSCIVEKL